MAEPAINLLCCARITVMLWVIFLRRTATYTLAANKCSVIRVGIAPISKDADSDIFAALSTESGLSLQLIENSDDFWGVQNENGSWNGLMKSLLDNHIDMTTSWMLPVPDRVRLVDFLTMPFIWKELGFALNSDVILVSSIYSWWKGLPWCIWILFATLTTMTLIFGCILSRIPLLRREVYCAIGFLLFSITQLFSTYLMDYRVLYVKPPVSNLDDAAEMVSTGMLRLVAHQNKMTGHLWRKVEANHPKVTQALRTHTLLQTRSPESSLRVISRHPWLLTYGSMPYLATLLRNAHIRNVVLFQHKLEGFAYGTFLVRPNYACRSQINTAAVRIFELGIQQRIPDTVDRYRIHVPKHIYHPIHPSDINSLLFLLATGILLAVLLFGVEAVLAAREGLLQRLLGWVTHPHICARYKVSEIEQSFCEQPEICRISQTATYEDFQVDEHDMGFGSDDCC